MDYMIINTALTPDNEEQWNDLPLFHPAGTLTTEHDECTGEEFTNRKENNFILFKWTMIV